MMSIRQNTPRGLPHASRILLLCVIHMACALADKSRPAARFIDPRGHALINDLKFTHLTTNDGLSQGYVTAILQDRRGLRAVS